MCCPLVNHCLPAATNPFSHISNPSPSNPGQWTRDDEHVGQDKNPLFAPTSRTRRRASPAGAGAPSTPARGPSTQSRQTEPTTAALDITKATGKRRSTQITASPTKPPGKSSAVAEGTGRPMRAENSPQPTPAATIQPSPSSSPSPSTSPSNLPDTRINSIASGKRDSSKITQSPSRRGLLADQAGRKSAAVAGQTDRPTRLGQSPQPATPDAFVGNGGGRGGDGGGIDGCGKAVMVDGQSLSLASSGIAYTTRASLAKWVQCDNCDKWHEVPTTLPLSSLPEQVRACVRVSASACMHVHLRAAYARAIQLAQLHTRARACTHTHEHTQTQCI